MNDLSENNVARALRRWADPVPEDHLDRSYAAFLRRLENPPHRSWGRITVAASILGCAAIAWLITRPQPSEEAIPVASRQDSVEDLIERLGSDDLDERERATAELKRIGEPALDALRKAAESGDPERCGRAKAVLDAILLRLHGRIAYWGGPQSIRVVRPEGGEPVEVLPGIYAAYDSEIQWLPECEGIVASIDIPLEERFGSGAFPDLWTANADGSRRIRISRHQSTSQFAVSPDGKQVAYVAYSSGGHSNLGRIDIDGSNDRALTTDCWKVWDPAWSPDGKEVIFRTGLTKDWKSCVEGSWGLYRIAVSDGKREKFAEEFSYPSYTQDGRRLVALQYSGTEKPREIYLLDHSGKVLQTVVTGAMWDQPPKVDPSGTQVAFIRAEDKNIVIARLDGGGEQVVAPGSHPSWSPDGKALAYESRGFIFVYDLHEKKERRLVAGTKPTWSR